MTLLCCSNQLGYFPTGIVVFCLIVIFTAAGAERISPLMNEELFAARICEVSHLRQTDAAHLVRYFMMDDNIIVSLVDIPSMCPNGSTFICSVYCNNFRACIYNYNSRSYWKICLARIF